MYINMFHENKTQELHIVRCLFQFDWDNTIRNQIALTGWLGTVYIWGTFGQKMKNAVP